jgi:hypothetical protein
MLLMAGPGHDYDNILAVVGSYTVLLDSYQKKESELWRR